jgi:hypothetical protein
MTETLRGPVLTPPPAPTNLMTFHFSDGTSPLNRVAFKVIALGVAPGVRSDLDYDKVVLEDVTDGQGQLVVDDPRMAVVFQLIKDRIKKSGLDWEGVPGLISPLSGGLIMPASPYYANVPVVVELKDPDFSPPLRFDLKPGTYVTSWKRPPIGELNGQVFDSTCKYLDQLATSYSSLLGTASLPTQLQLATVRFSSLALRPVFEELNRRLAPNGPDVLELHRNLFDEIGREIQLPPGNRVLGYGVALGKIAKLACSELKGAAVRSDTLERLTRAVLGLVGLRFDRVSESAYEDYASLGTIVYLAAVAGLGFTKGSATASLLSSRVRVEAVVRR